MKKLLYPVSAIALLVASAFTVAKFQDWKISDNYSIQFTSDDPSGIFRGLKGTVNFDEANLADSKFDVSIDVSTINTGNGMKNVHAKSEKWFDVQKYPTITFVSKEITQTANGYEAKGDLQMHGVTKEIVMPFTFAKTANGGIFTSSFDINRMDYDVNTAEPNHGAQVLRVDISVPVTQ
jgi:polyisoprenoid-binding protein YceI